MTDNQNNDLGNFNFEKAMEEIKTIVSNIEDGKLPLEESIKQYERAMQLIKKSQELLQSAHKKIEDITAANSASGSNSD